MAVYRLDVALPLSLADRNHTMILGHYPALSLEAEDLRATADLLAEHGVDPKLAVIDEFNRLREEQMRTNPRAYWRPTSALFEQLAHDAQARVLAQKEL